MDKVMEAKRSQNRIMISWESMIEAKFGNQTKIFQWSSKKMDTQNNIVFNYNQTG